MKIVDAFWLGSVGFVKLNNGFETRVLVGPAQGVNETYDAEFIAKNGAIVPYGSLLRFLENDTYSNEYIPE
jgi:hypothetical protein